MDPLIVVAAITAIVQLITICMDRPTPAEVARSAKSPSRRQRRQMENAVWSELRSRGQQQKFIPTMRALRAEIGLMTAEEIEAICEDCTQGTADYGD